MYCYCAKDLAVKEYNSPGEVTVHKIRPDSTNSQWKVK